MSPSVKHHEFVDEPMRDKPVSAIAGIAHNPCKILVDLGYDKAYVLFEQFLIYRKEKWFIEWLMAGTFLFELSLPSILHYLFALL
ncbi:unnamed protein product [Angiostrongylus costaricensis]|uniref:DUF3961 domain-containing protein n=1 Tax=Angiostrongylus costaricensis TaxID=334426 RepID=A0A0R3Q258_ANGCS|nr:unnamed protein product [Angiostrongylus costaricensis]